MEYIAVYEEAKSSISLIRDSQMEEHLARGANIYRREGGDMELIATPADGFLVERPVFPEAETMRVGGNSELEQAARILLGMEE